MSKKFWMAPLAALAMACTLALSACGAPSAEGMIREDIKTSFAKLDAENEELIEAAEAAVGGAFDQFGIDTEEFATAYFGDFTYEIGDIAVDDEAKTAQANVTINIKSITGIMNEFSRQYQEYMDSLDLSTLDNDAEVYAGAGEVLLQSVEDVAGEDVEVVFNYRQDDEGAWVLEGYEPA